MQHLVLVFPGQRIADGEHVAFTRHFGEPEIFHQQIIRSQRVPEIFRVSNVDDDGNLMPPEHPTVQQVSLAQFWHTDSSYRTIPCTGALLHGVEVSRTGGETQFTNMYLVYEALPDSLRRQVEGRRARHNFGHLHTLRDLKPLTEAERAAMPPVWQPMVRRHPVTGRKSLYISPIYNDEVEGMAPGAAQAADRRPDRLRRPGPLRLSPSLGDRRRAAVGQPLHDARVTPHDPRERRVMHRTTHRGRRARARRLTAEWPGSAARDAFARPLIR